jgi:hypothetical protein
LFAVELFVTIEKGCSRILPKVLKIKKAEFMVTSWQFVGKTRGRYMYYPPPAAEGNFVDESGNVLKPHIIQHYTSNMGYIDVSERIGNSCRISRRIWKLTKKLFFKLS